MTCWSSSCRLLDKRQKQAKWYKAVDARALVVDVYDIAPEHFAGWIKQRLQSRALRVESGVIEQLAVMTEGQLACCCARDRES